MAATFACTLCKAIFTKGEHLRRHERAHTGEKPFVCSVCEKAFARSDVLSKHLRYHERKDGILLSRPLRNDVVVKSRSKSSTMASNTLSFTKTNDIQNKTSSKSDWDENETNIKLEGIKSEFSTSPPHREASPPLYDSPTSTTSAQPTRADPTSKIPIQPIQYRYPESISFHEVVSTSSLSQDQSELPHSSQSQYSNYAFYDPVERPSFQLPAYSHPLSNNGLCISDPLNQSLPFEMTCNENDNAAVDGAALFDQLLRNLPGFMTADQEPDYVSYIDYIKQTKPNSRNDKQVDGFRYSDESRRRLMAIKSIWPNRPITVGNYENKNDLTNTSVAALASPSASLPERLVHGVLTAREFKPFDMPTKGFVVATVDLYFREFHPSHPIIHRLTFNSQHSHPLLLASMCAIGARYVGTPDAIKFSTALWERTAERTLNENCTGENEIFELMQATYLAECYGLLFGDPSMLQTSLILHNSLVTRANQINLFDQVKEEEVEEYDENAENFVDVNSNDPVLQWQSWIRKEMRKRMALHLFLQDAAIHSVARTHAPLLSLSTMNVRLPSSSNLFDAPFEKWLSCPRESTLTVRDIVSNLYCNVDMQGAYLNDSLSLKLILCATFCQMRFRVLANVPISKTNVWSVSQAQSFLTIDIVSAHALSNWRKYYTLPFGQDSHHSFIIFNIIQILMLTDLDLIELATGRDGPDAAERALKTLKTQWASTMQARRAVLHAAQILLYLRIVPTCHSAAIYMWTVTFHAAMVLHVYGWTCQDVGKPFVLTDAVDWDAVGVLGFDSDDDIMSLNSDNWAIEFITKGGQAQIFNYGNLSTTSCRTQIRVDILMALRSYASGAWQVSNVFSEICALLALVDTEARPALFSS